MEATQFDPGQGSPVRLEVLSPDGSQTRTIEVPGGLSDAELHDVAQRARADFAADLAGPPPDTSYGSALMSGLHNAAAGFGSTARVIGDAAGMPGLSDAGRSIAGAVGQPQGYDPAGPKVVEGFRRGDWRSIASNLPRAAVEAAPDLIGNIAAGTLGSAVGGPAGGVAGVAAYNGGRTFGETAESRAANNDHPTPTAGDLSGAALTTLATSALTAAGIGRVPGIGTAIEAAPSILRPVAAAAAEGIGAAGADAVQQAGNTLGTARGLAIDPAEAAAAGAQGAVARFGQSAIPVAGEITQAGAKRVAGAMLPTPDVAEAQSITRVLDAAARYRQQAEATTGRSLPDGDVLGGLHQQLTANVGEIARGLKDSGAVTPEEYRQVVLPAVRQAREGQAPTVALEDLDLPAAIAEPFGATLRDLRTLATTVQSRGTTGPLEQLGQRLSAITTAAGLIAAGGTHGLGMPEALAGAAGALLGGRKVNNVGGLVGRAADQALGLNAPDIALRGPAAAAVVRRAGLSPGDDPAVASARLIATLNDPQARLNLSLGLPLDTPAAPPGPTPEQARGLALSEQAGRLVERNAIDRALQAGRDAAGQPEGEDPAATPWKPGDPPVGLAAIRAAAQRSAAIELARQAAGMTPEAVAQRRVDRDARNAAAALAGEALAPSEDAGGNDTAVAAAVAQAARRAATVRRLAGEGANAADRAAVGLPLRDPVPVGVPLAADGRTPIDEPSAGASRVSAGVPSDPAMSPPDGSSSPAAQLPTGWLAYVLSGLMRAGVAAKPADVHGALSDLVAAGELRQDHADALRAHRGPVMVPELLNRIAAATAQRTGQGDRLDAGLSSPPDVPTSSRGPIRDAERWHAAREDRKAAAEALADQAERQGDHPLATVVRQVAAEPTAEGKRAIAAAYLASIKGNSETAVRRRARATMVLTGPLMKGV
ncbi:MAG: hypothetical protein J0H67_05020 [Rhodospirillales bacterium]|nr:hypothetical protein [Rhodospirillales bacterium]